MQSKPDQTTTTDSTLTCDGKTRPWGAILTPLAAGALLSGCAVITPKSDIPAPLPPATAADFERANLYARLNAEVAGDPKLSGTILIVDPTPYPTVSSLLRDVQPKLQGLVSPWRYDHFNPPLYRITGPIHKVAQAEDKINASPQDNETLTPFRPLIDISGVTGRSFFTNDNPNNPNYVCLAVGVRGNIPFSDFVEKNFSLFSKYLAHFTPKFQEALNANENNGLTVPRHELGHCIHGYKQKPGESDMAMARRLESEADATEMLLRIRDGEPDMLAKLETKAQWRRANSFRTRNFDIIHDTSAALRLIVDDLRQNPQLGDTLKGLSLTEIGIKASAYAARAQLQEYPHLADQNLSNKEKLARSFQIDAEINLASNFVSSKMLLVGYDQQPLTLPLNSALRTLQLAHTAEQYLTQPPQSKLADGVAQLRAQFPDVMQQADRIFADELKRYPPLACAAVNQHPAATPVAQRQLSPRPTPRHAHRSHTNHRAALIHKPAR